MCMWYHEIELGTNSGVYTKWFCLVNIICIHPTCSIIWLLLQFSAGVSKLFLKGPDINILGFVGHIWFMCVITKLLLLQHEYNYGQYVIKLLWLFSNGIFLQKRSGEPD